MKINTRRCVVAVVLALTLLMGSTVSAAAAGIPEPQMTPAEVLAINAAFSPAEMTETVPAEWDNSIMPYDMESLDPATVYVNGKKVVFDDVFPQSVYDSWDVTTYIPLRKLMEALGGTVDFTSETSLISATYEGTTISFAVGSKEAVVTDAKTDQTYTYEMMPTPRYAGGRVMITPEVLSDCFGLLASSGFYEISIIDLNVAMKDFGDHFVIMDKLMTLSATQTNYKSNGTYEGNVNAKIPALTGSQSGVSLPISGSFSSEYSNRAMAGNIALKAGLDDVVKILPDEIKNDPMVPLAVAALQNVEMSYIYDVEKGVVYIKCPLLTTYVFGMSKADWVKIDMAELGMTDALTLSDTSELTFSQLVEITIRSQAQSSYVDYETLTATLMAFETFFGDDNFTKTGTDAAPVYTLNITKDALLDYIIEMSEILGAPITREELLEELDEFDFNLKLTLAFKNETSYTADVDFRFAFGIDDVSMKMDFKANESFPGKSVMDMTFDVNIPDVYAIALTFKSDSTSTLSNAPVATEPPSSAVVVDVTDF